MIKLICTFTISMLLLISNSYSQSIDMAIIKSNKQMYLVKFSETSNERIKSNSHVNYSMNYNPNELLEVVTQIDYAVFDVEATKGKSKSKSATMIQYQLLGTAGGLTKISLCQYQNSLNDIKKRRSLHILRVQSKVLEIKYFNKKQLGGWKNV